MTRNVPVPSRRLPTALFTRVLAVGFVVAGLSTGLSAQELPLRAEVVGITGNAVEYVLTNQGPRAATAWTIEFTSTDSAGEKRQRRETVDTSPSTVNSQLNPSVAPSTLESKARRGLTTHVGTSPGATATSVDARVIAAVFEDGTSIGDSTTIDGIFASRQARRDTLAALLSALRAARAKGGRPQDLEELAVQTEANRQDYPAPAVAARLLQNLELAKASMSKGLADSNSALRDLEDIMTIQHAAAVKHAARAK